MIVANALAPAARALARREVALATIAPLYALPIEGPPDATLALPPGGGDVEHPIVVPALPGSDALDVTRAEVSLRGVAVDAPWATANHASGTVAELRVPPPESGEALLTELRIEALRSPNRKLGGLLLGDGDAAAARAVRLVLSVRSGGQWSAPAAAAPAFGAPGGSALYPSMLAGAQLVAATSQGVTLAIDPPLRCDAVRVRLLEDADGDVSPTTSKAVDWSASSVRARFRVTPSDVSLSLVAGERAQDVGGLPSLDGRVALELSGALGALLDAARETSADGRLSVGLRVQAGSAGLVEVRLGLAAWHRKDLPPEPGVLLRGSPAALRRVSLPGVVPRACRGALHGLWGPARLVANADRDAPDARAGVQLVGARRVARWLPLTALESERRLLRLGVYARALEPAELLLAVYGGDPGVVGRALGRPAIVSAEPAREPSWLRAELADGGATGRPGVWLVARVSRGAVQLYARDGGCQISPDAGETWSVASQLPLVQAHYDAEADPLAPLSLRAGGALIDADLRRRGQVDPRGMRVELAPLLDAPALRAAVDADGACSLTLACDQDVDLTTSDLALLYDPWHPGGV